MTTTVHPETESEKLILQPIPLHAPKAGARISAEEFAALSPVDRVKAAYDIHGSPRLCVRFDYLFIVFGFWLS